MFWRLGPLLKCERPGHGLRSRPLRFVFLCAYCDPRSDVTFSRSLRLTCGRRHSLREVLREFVMARSRHLRKATCTRERGWDITVPRSTLSLRLPSHHSTFEVEDISCLEVIRDHVNVQGTVRLISHMWWRSAVYSSTFGSAVVFVPRRVVTKTRSVKCCAMHVCSFFWSQNISYGGSA